MMIGCLQLNFSVRRTNIYPQSFAELAAVAGGPRNAEFRMVVGYWDMAASRRASAIAAANARAANPPPQAG